MSGYKNLMVFDLKAADMSDVEDLSITLEDHFTTKKATHKLILFSKPFKFSHCRKYTSDTDSDSDFEQPMFRSTPNFAKAEKDRSETNTISGTSQNHEDSELCNLDCSDDREQQLQERRALIAQQDNEYQLNLQADKLKEQLKKEVHEKETEQKNQDEARSNYLKALQEQRRLHVPEEAAVSDNCCIISINHIVLGRQTRFVDSASKMETVYDWIGSLSKEYEFFELCYGYPLQVADPNESVSKFEKLVLHMRECTNSNFTMDIRFQENLTEQSANPSVRNKPQIQDRNKDRLVNCVICSLPIPAVDIESHSTACAQAKYPEIIETDSGSDSEEERNLQPMLVVNTSHFDTMKIVETLKKCLASCETDDDNAMRMKIRRGQFFEDFCQKVKNPWVQEKMGMKLAVHYYGETGIDQGGLSREFYSGKLIYLYILVFSEITLSISAN